MRTLNSEFGGLKPQNLIGFNDTEKGGGVSYFFAAGVSKKWHSRHSPHGPELKGRWASCGGLGLSPSGHQTAICRRVGMSAKWELAVSVGDFCLCSSRLDQQKNHDFFWCVWVGFLSLASYLIFFWNNVLCFDIQQPESGCSWPT